MAYGSQARMGVRSFDRAPRRHMIDDRMHAKLSLVLNQDTVCDLGRSSLIESCSATRFTNALVDAAWPPVAERTIGQNDAPSIFLTLDSYARRFSVSCFLYVFSIEEVEFVGHRRINTRTSKKVRSNLPPQTPLAEMSSLAPDWTFDPGARGWSTGCNWGSTEKSWHASVKTFANRSRISLWRIIGKPPRGHDKACSTLKSLEHTHLMGIWSGCSPYLNARASLSPDLLINSPSEAMGNAASHAEAPFSCDNLMLLFRIGSDSSFTTDSTCSFRDACLALISVRLMACWSFDGEPTKYSPPTEHPEQHSGAPRFSLRRLRRLLWQSGTGCTRTRGGVGLNSRGRYTWHGRIHSSSNKPLLLVDGVCRWSSGFAGTDHRGSRRPSLRVRVEEEAGPWSRLVGRRPTQRRGLVTKVPHLTLPNHLFKSNIITRLNKIDPMTLWWGFFDPMTLCIFGFWHYGELPKQIKNSKRWLKQPSKI